MGSCWRPGRWAIGWPSAGVWGPPGSPAASAVHPTQEILFYTIHHCVSYSRFLISTTQSQPLTLGICCSLWRTRILDSHHLESLRGIIHAWKDARRGLSRDMGSVAYCLEASWGAPSDAKVVGKSSGTKYQVPPLNCSETLLRDAREIQVEWY